MAGFILFRIEEIIKFSLWINVNKRTVDVELLAPRWSTTTQVMKQRTPSFPVRLMLVGADQGVSAFVLIRAESRNFRYAINLVYTMVVDFL